MKLTTGLKSHEKAWEYILQSIGMRKFTLNINRYLFVLSLFLCLSLLTACSKNKQSIYKKSKSLMDTFVTITVVSDSENKADKAIENAFSTIEGFGNLINFFSDKSELTMINANAGIKEWNKKILRHHQKQVQGKCHILSDIGNCNWLFIFIPS